MNKKQVVRQEITSIQFVGPLPPPATLKQYDEVLPGGAERIMAMAERQSSHRQELERKVIDSNCANERLGTILGFILALIALGGGFYLVANGMDAAGIASIVLSLGVPAGAFFYGKRHQKQERMEKLQQFAKQQ